ncbi:MAG: transporter substrate-binding domain-containing protein, partial [Clostridia bacterium]|nr:transporter substrate-binding domain-containing protein [Clostridia bacterium]
MGTVAFADGVDGPMQKAKLTVGINAEFPPFEYYEGEELKGFDIDLMNYIGERIGFDIEFVNMSFDKLIPAVVNGEVNCAISAITITKERESVIDYSNPYLIANVTYKDGEDWAKSKEKYAIVFPSMDKTSIKSSVTSEEFVYSQINIAIEELRDNHTIEKLVEKYNLNKPFDGEADANYSYVIPTTTVDDVDAEPIDEVDWTEATTVPAPSEWASKDIDLAYAVGIADTNKDYIYKNNITREEFCELIYNLVVLVSPDIEYFIPDSFADTKNEKVLKLNSLGIINGKTATDFAPDDYLTREEAATIIVRMVNKVVPMAATEMWFEYDDIGQVSEWASDSIQTISNLGFMNGVGNNKFAPKETYTTEQAIATLVRVYNAAEASGVVKHDSSIGIIGGADGPTSIIVGGNTTVIGDEGYNKFYAEVTKNTTKVDKFYVDEAIKLITEAGTLAADRDFISLYTTNDEMTNKLLALGAVDFNKPTDIFYLYADKEQMIENIKALAGEDAEDINFEQLEKLNKRYNFSTLASLINASYGAENLAALTIL